MTESPLRPRMKGIDETFTPVILFAGFYLAITLAGQSLVSGLELPALWALQWVALFAVAIATSATILLVDGGRWPLGLSVPWNRALRALARGILFGTLVVVAGHVAILATTSLTMRRGGSLDFGEWAFLFIPAVFHEELLFRGYPFQRLVLWNRNAGIAISSTLFAALHLNNASLSSVGIINIFLAGGILAVAFIDRWTLWFPLAMHLAWNVVSGPILGHEVSGYQPRGALFRQVDRGPQLLTGGEFGIEGSLWMTVAEAILLIVLVMRMRRNEARAKLV